MLCGKSSLTVILQLALLKESAGVSFLFCFFILFCFLKEEMEMDNVYEVWKQILIRLFVFFKDFIETEHK